MSELPDHAFEPASGRLGQMIFENPGEQIAPRLEFFIEIAFRPFDWEGDTVSPILRVNRLIAEVRQWRELAGKELVFPYFPKPGSLDAGVHLFQVQNPADVTALHFGEIEGGRLPVRFDAEVDFEIEADSEMGQVPLSLVCHLEPGPLRVATSLEKRNEADPDRILAEIAALVDVSAYGPLEKVPGGFELAVDPL